MKDEMLCDDILYDLEDVGIEDLYKAKAYNKVRFRSNVKETDRLKMEIITVTYDFGHNGFAYVLNRELVICCEGRILLADYKDEPHRIAIAHHSILNVDDISLDGVYSDDLNNISKLFFGCKKIRKINMGSTLDLSKCKYYTATFASCFNLEEVDFCNRSLGTPSLTNMMFMKCRSLKHLDLRTMDMSKIVSTFNMIEGVPCEVLVNNSLLNNYYMSPDVTCKFKIT